MGGIGPGPFAGMMLADMGAEIVRVERPGVGELLGSGASRVVDRGRARLAVDLKGPRGREQVLALVEAADALIEGFRPGVMERLGLGPEEALDRNPRLVYGRITGYGQEGPLAAAVGHDINYIATSGVLGAIARSGERPLFPLNLVGDYGGGGMLIAFGLVCALLEARRSGRGQVVDAAMVDGSALLASAIHGMLAAGEWSERPGTNVLDSGAHFYEVYETSDGGHVAVGAIEPRFYAALLDALGVDPAEAPQWDRERWPELKRRFAALFRRRSRDEWAVVFEGSDACATPVLSMSEAFTHPHNVARDTFVEVDGVVRPAPAPRYGRTPAATAAAELDLSEVLARWGVEELASRSAAGRASAPQRS